MTHSAPVRTARSQRRRLWLALAGAWLLGTASCASAADDPSHKLTISYSEKVGDNMPLWIAVDAGYFTKRGLDVTAQFLPAREGVPALLTGQVQMAAIGGADGLAAVAQGAKLKFVATFSPVYTFQFWAQPRSASAAGLKGQRIGVSSTTGSQYTSTVIALKQIGLSPSDVAITPLGTVPNVDKALIAGSIAAGSSHPPATYEFQQHGITEMVDLAAKRIANVNTGLMTEQAFIDSHRDVVQRVVDAIVEALQREKADQAFAESEIASHMGVKEKAVLDFTYKFYANEVAPSVPMPQADQLDAAKQALSVTNAKVRTVDAASMIDQSFVRQAVAHQGAK